MLIDNDSDGYDGTDLPSCDISDVGCISRSGGGHEDSEVRYAPLTQAYLFIAIAAEIMRAINSDGIEFLDDLGRRITQVTYHNREKAFLYQRLSVLIQRYNAVAILDTFAHNPWRRDLAVPADQFLTFIFNPRDLYYRGY